MPCSCAGVRRDKCDCTIIGTNGEDNIRNGLVFVGKKNSICCLGDKNMLPFRYKYNLIIRFLDGFYEKCATYNSRYCPFPGQIGGNNSLHRALKDFLILICFLIANSVVLFIIVTRMTLHLSFFTIDSVKWLKRYVYKYLYVIAYST